MLLPGGGSSRRAEGRRAGARRRREGAGGPPRARLDLPAVPEPQLREPPRLQPLPGPRVAARSCSLPENDELLNELVWRIFRKNGSRNWLILTRIPGFVLQNSLTLSISWISVKLCEENLRSFRRNVKGFSSFLHTQYTFLKACTF